MSGQIVDREMTDKEQQFLADLLQHSPSNVKRWMEGAQNALVLGRQSIGVGTALVAPGMANQTHSSR
jgi:hypothetical protein